MTNRCKIEEEYYPSGKIKFKSWGNGVFHRINGPAYVAYYESGQISDEQWMTRGRWHRKNGPAIIKYYKSGRIRDEQWMIHGHFHRDNGPAIIEYYENGQIDFKIWLLNGKRHWPIAPAFIKYDEKGNMTIQEYWWNGYNITDFVKKIFGNIPEKITKEEQILLKLSLPDNYFLL